MQELQSLLQELLFCDLLDLGETLDNLKDGFVQQAVGQPRQQFIGHPLLVLAATPTSCVRRLLRGCL